MDCFPPSTPVEFLDPSLDLKNRCLSLLPHLFSMTVTSCNDDNDISINQLHTEGFHIEDIWQQIELLNEPLISQANQLNLQSLTRSSEPVLTSHILRHCPTTATEDYSIDGGLVSDEGNDESDDESNYDNDDQLSSEEEGDNSVDNDIDNDEGPDEDRFFNMAEMESFVQEAENYRENNDSDSDDDSIDLFDVHAGETGGLDSDDSAGSHADSDPDQEDQYYYKDFFDPVLQPSSTTSHSSKDVSQPLEVGLSAHQKKQNKIAEHIARLEARNLEGKSWQMSGEAGSKVREENSLLQEHLLFDHVTCPAPDITEEVTFALEDVIKQRIKDKSWDDVVRKEKPKEKPFNYQLVQPLNQEKSKQSLAEVYEQEFLKQTQIEKQDQENPQHEDIKRLMKKLFAELDALSNFHFTPQMPETEIKSMPNLPSIALEEVAPVTHSDAMLLAPEELQAKSRKTEIGLSERSKTDKKRERRSKKKFQSQNKEKIQAAKNKLATTRSVKKNKATRNTDTIRSSDKFFAKLSESVKNEVEGKKFLKGITSTSKNKAKHLKL